MASKAASEVRPSNWPLLTSLPLAVNASLARSMVSPAAGSITCLIGKSYFRANSKSRWSWAGTAITAPEP